MKNIDSIFDFYLKNKLYTEMSEKTQKVFAIIIAISDYNKTMNFNLQTVIKMILLENAKLENLTNKTEANEILNVFYNLETTESLEAKNSIERAKKLNADGIEDELNRIFGRLLIAIGIDIEGNLKLEFDKLYERIVKITDKELEEEKNTRLKYFYYNTYNVTNEYAYLISLLEDIISLKLIELKNSKEANFKEQYVEQNRFYKSMPILNGILEKTKKL